MLYLVHNQEMEMFIMTNTTGKITIMATVILTTLAIIALAIFTPNDIDTIATIVVIMLTVAGMFYALGDKSDELN